jgi:hypothetical protein
MKIIDGIYTLKSKYPRTIGGAAARGPTVRTQPACHIEQDVALLRKIQRIG